MSTIDFDAFRAEQKREPITLRLRGKEYVLPPSMPATVALDVARMHTDLGDDTDVPTEKLIELGSNIFGGEDVFLTVLKEGAVTMEELPDLMKMVIARYSGADPNSSAPKKKGAKKSASTSSETGDSSRPTSSESTAST